MEDTKRQAWKVYKPSELNLVMTTHILKEAQSFLASVNDNANRITQRAYTLLAILIAFLSVIYSFLWSSILNNNSTANEFWMLGLVLIPLFYPIVLLLKLIFPRTTFVNGRRPKSIELEKFQHIPKEDKEQVFYLSEIKIYQDKIEKTEIQNDTRAKYLKRAIRIISATALLILIVLLVIYITSNVGESAPVVPSSGVCSGTS